MAGDDDDQTDSDDQAGTKPAGGAPLISDGAFGEKPSKPAAEDDADADDTDADDTDAGDGTEDEEDEEDPFS